MTVFSYIWNWVYSNIFASISEKYFSMNKKHCKEALDIYKKFIVAMDKVSDFLKVAEVSLFGCLYRLYLHYV